MNPEHAHTIQMIVTIICSVFASSGFWAWMQYRRSKTDNITKLILGLAHDRIMALGMRYIERGWVSRDEYENLYEYLYVPYAKKGGNGSAKRVMDEVKRLPFMEPTAKNG